MRELAAIEWMMARGETFRVVFEFQVSRGTTAHTKKRNNGDYCHGDSFVVATATTVYTTKKNSHGMIYIMNKHSTSLPACLLAAMMWRRKKNAIRRALSKRVWRGGLDAKNNFMHDLLLTISFLLSPLRHIFGFICNNARRSCNCSNSVTGT